jgi:hypothetical protein
MIVSSSDARIQSTAARISWSVMFMQWQTIMAQGFRNAPAPRGGRLSDH